MLANTVCLSNPKLKNETYCNPLGMPKYYAGYSVGFVEDSINYLCSGVKKTILDPWAGLGTTGWVGQQKGHKVNLLDLNPVMSICCAASDLILRTEKYKSSITNLLCQLNRNVEELGWNISEHHKVAEHGGWTRPIADALRFIAQSGMFLKNNELSPSHSLIVVALINIYRKNVSSEKSSNPTYYKSFSVKSRLPSNNKDTFFTILSEEVKRLVHNLENFSKVNLVSKLSAYQGDSRSILIPEATIDVVITSPPYCTRIDYAKMTSIELSVLEMADICQFDTIRRSLMGAPTINITDGFSCGYWGDTCNTFLESVKNHPSHGSKNYYYKNFVQYFDDAFRSLQEIKRCLKNSGKGLLVIQNSYYKEHEIKLSQIYLEMFFNIGMKATILKKYDVNQCISSKKPMSIYSNKNNRNYTEDILYFKKTR